MSRWDDAEAEFYGKVVPAFLGGGSPSPVEHPPEPASGDSTWYGDWECGWEPERANWTGEGYVAYKGGCDLDARYVTASTWDKLLEAVDDEEE